MVAFKWKLSCPSLLDKRRYVTEPEVNVLALNCTSKQTYETKHLLPTRLLCYLATVPCYSYWNIICESLAR